MTRDKRTYPEESLDPEDWQEMQALGCRMVDDMLEYTRTLHERPPWQHAPWWSLQLA